MDDQVHKVEEGKRARRSGNPKESLISKKLLEKLGVDEGELERMSIRDRNKLLKKNNIPKSDCTNIKGQRRRRKNRKYAKNCRDKLQELGRHIKDLDEQRTSTEAEITRVKEQIREVKAYLNDEGEYPEERKF